MAQASHLDSQHYPQERISFKAQRHRQKVECVHHMAKSVSHCVDDTAYDVLEISILDLFYCMMNSVTQLDYNILRL